ncbi:MAG: hypothetical protein V3S29_09785 [bacterium]
MEHNTGRIPMIQPEDATGQVKNLYDAATAVMGRVANSYRTIANSPHVGSLLLPFAATLQREGAGSVLSAKLKEMVIIKTSHTNGCAY